MENQETDEFNELQAEAHVWNTMFAYMNSLSIKCAVQLGILDIINSHGQPMSLTKLASSLQIHPSKTTHLHQLMLVLVHSAYFKKQEEEGGEVVFSLTPPSKILLKQRATNVSPFLLAFLDPYITDPWHRLSSWFQGMEGTPFETAHGVPFWRYMKDHPVTSNLFDKAMASDTEMVMKTLVRDGGPVFQGLTSLVDVGGGNGTAAMALAKGFPHMKCMVLDLPQVVSTLGENSSVRFIAGDMYESIPNANAVFMKWTLHAWSDEDCVKILKRCKEAIPSKEEGGKVIIVEMVVNPKGDHKSLETQLLFSLWMMTVVGGKERTEKEWENIILRAGFTHYKITPILGLRSVIEVFP